MARIAIGVLMTCCFGAIAVLSSSAFATQSESPTHTELAAIDTIALQRDLATLAAPIRSEHSLNRHLSAGLAESPLRYLGQPALRRFLASLEFNELGLTTFRYTELEDELTPTQIYEVLSLFGQQHQTPKLRYARVVTPLDADILRGAIPGVMPAGLACDVVSIGEDQCGDRKDYRCISPGTCGPSDTLICTSNC